MRRNARLYTYGPRELGLQMEDESGGPEEFIRRHPNLFATSSTSAHEGYFFWALLKLIGPMEEIGKGGLIWYYQSRLLSSGGKAGGTIVDFLVEGVYPNKDLGIRIQTPFRHTGAGAITRAKDEEQALFMESKDIIPVDVYSINYMSDKTGQAVIKAANRALKADPDFSPLARFNRY
jgi:hypothetical protein